MLIQALVGFKDVVMPALTEAASVGLMIGLLWFGVLLAWHNIKMLIGIIRER